MLIDMHAHTSAISLCCNINSEQAFQIAKEKGFDGLAVANHYKRRYFDERSYEAWLQKYILEWRNCKEIASRLGMKCFYGIEVSVYEDRELHFLIYGANESFIRENPYLCERTQRELFELCNRYNLAFVQAHPLRCGASIQDTGCLHGLEINCHPLYGETHADSILRIVKEKSLAVTVGCDYHGDTYRAEGGSFLPDYIESDEQLAAYIRSANEFSFQIHEPKTGEVYSSKIERK